MSKVLVLVVLSCILNGLIPEGKAKEGTDMIMGLMLLSAVIEAIGRVLQLI